ncbi:MAG: anthranilate synthase component I family protein [Anaerolineales bacterium]
MFESSTETIINTVRPNLVPVVRELPADLETPVSVYLKLAGAGPSFLLESVTGGEQVARYSFIGVQPRRAYVLRGREMMRIENQHRQVQVMDPGDDPLDYLRQEMAAYRPSPLPGLPRLMGGLVGYLGYDLMPFFEPRVPLNRHRQDHFPEALFLLTDTLVAFDHAFGRVLLIANADLDQGEAQAMAAAERRLDQLEAAITGPLPELSPGAGGSLATDLESNTTRDEFLEAVRRAKEHIAAGDIFQVVLSQRLFRQTSARPFDIYRSLRRLNPSPYMFFFDFGDLAGPEPLYLIGASPEMHVRLKDGAASVRPIAGTRRRGADPAEDDRQEADLLADPKELAEHVMLVDLARNDLGRVCEYGSVHVPELMGVERYSHVMHIVSQVEGQIRPEFDAFDLLRVTFPAGTVSGAPKIRAMEIIADLEKDGRGPYAGAVGYFSYDGSMDTCITIRTLIMEGGRVSVQAGAGNEEVLPTESERRLVGK